MYAVFWFKCWYWGIAWYIVSEIWSRNDSISWIVRFLSVGINVLKFLSGFLVNRFHFVALKLSKWWISFGSMSTMLFREISMAKVSAVWSLSNGRVFILLLMLGISIRVSARQISRNDWAVVYGGISRVNMFALKFRASVASQILRSLPWALEIRSP